MKWKAQSENDGVLTIAKEGERWFLIGNESTVTARLWGELLRDANAAAALRVELDVKAEELRSAGALKDQQINNAIAAANREYARAEAAEAELEQLRAAQPPPEPEDVAELRAKLEAAEYRLRRALTRAESAEHQARVWASGKIGDPAAVHSYALRSQGKALDAALAREGETLRRLRESEAEVARVARALADQVAATTAAERALDECRAEAKEPDPGGPLTLDVDKDFFHGLSTASIYRGPNRTESDLFISGVTVDSVEADRLAEMVRCYNLIHFDADSKADEEVGLAIGEYGDETDRAAAEEIGRRVAGAFTSAPADLPLRQRLIASIALAEIQKARGTFKPAATIDEAVDRAMAPVTEEQQAQDRGDGMGRYELPSCGDARRLGATDFFCALARGHDGDHECLAADGMTVLLSWNSGGPTGGTRLGPRPSWDRTMAQTFDAQVGGEAQSLPVEGEVGSKPVASAPTSAYERHYLRRVEQGTGERILEVREELAGVAGLPATLPEAEALIAAEEHRLRNESLIVPSFSVGALWMWKLLTGRGERS